MPAILGTVAAGSTTGRPSTFARLASQRPYEAVTRTFGIAQDITERREAETARRHVANHDPLTGPADRARFSDRVGTISARRTTDVDHLEKMNDTLGRSAGDALQRVVADRVSAAFGAEGPVARVGGGESGVASEGAATSGLRETPGHALASAVQPKFVHDDRTI